MKIAEKPTIILCFVLCLLGIAAGCGSNADRAEATEPIVLKDVTLDEQTVFDNNRLQNSRKLSRQEMQRLSIRKIDSSAVETAVVYHILDTLYSASSTAIIVAREYAEENCVWLAIYARDKKLITSQLLYEDNSEGSYRVNSVIKNNVITSTIMNKFADSDKDVVKVFGLSSDNLIVAK